MNSLALFAATHRKAVLVASGAVFVIVWGLPTLVIPFAADQSWFALGARTILDGDQLYRDFHEQKTPLIYLIYAVPRVLGGETYESVRVLDMAITLMAMGGVFLLTRRFLPERAAILAAAVYGFVYLTTAKSDGLAETESFIVAPLTLALAIYPVGSGRRVMPAAFASGLLLGIAFGLKFSVAPFVLALPVLEAMLRDQQSWRPAEAIGRLTVAAAGFLLVQAAWVGYLVLAGTLDDFIDIQRNYTIPYQDLRWTPDGIAFPRFVLTSSGAWMSLAWYVTAPAWAGLMMLLVRGPRPAGYFLGLLAAFAIVSVWWQAKFFAYHWIITLPFLAALAGYLVHEGIEALRGLSRTALAVAVAAALFGVATMITGPLFQTYDAYVNLYDRVSGERSQAEIDGYSNVLALNHELVDYVRAHSEPNEAFVIWGTWPTALLWADRPSSTNFITSPGLRADWAPDKWREEYIDDLRSSPPRFFAVADGDFQPWLTGHDRSSRQDFCDHFPELRAFVDADYLAVLNNGLFILYDREATVSTARGACP